MVATGILDVIIGDHCSLDQKFRPHTSLRAANLWLPIEGLKLLVLRQLGKRKLKQLTVSVTQGLTISTEDISILEETGFARGLCTDTILPPASSINKKVYEKSLAN